MDVLPRGQRAVPARQRLPKLHRLRRAAVPRRSRKYVTCRIRLTNPGADPRVQLVIVNGHLYVDDEPFWRNLLLAEATYDVAYCSFTAPPLVHAR